MDNIRIIASDQELMEQLELRDWGELWLKLTARVVWILKNRYEVSWNGLKIKDFCRQMISEVFDKIFLEKARNWNIRRYPDFEEFVIGVIDSHINNTLNKDGLEDNFDEESLAHIESLNIIEPGALLQSGELRTLIFSHLTANGATDDELLVFECMADGICKPQDIRQELGLSQEQYHNISRTLERKRKVIKAKLVDYGK